MGRNKQGIGIIGGAGPMAGVLFHKKIVQIAQRDYGCHNDYDFPLIVHIGYPFSDMLTQEAPRDLIQQELKECFKTLATLEVGVIAIACNTLHGYLEEAPKELVHMAQVVETRVKKERTLVLCTASSRKNHVYEGMIYPSNDDQKRIDEGIHAVLRGEITREGAQMYAACIQRAKEANKNIEAVILGCTEISELHDAYPITAGLPIIDPLVVLAKEVCQRAFAAV